MPDTTFLHIQTREPATTRVQELSGLSVRIGAGSQCEVRLPDSSLAEVQCLLRRRGENWYLQPIGPAGGVTIDGRPVEHQRLLPLGRTIRLGDHWLTLHPSGQLTPAFGSYERPIPVEPVTGFRTNVPPVEPEPLSDQRDYDPTRLTGMAPPVEVETASEWESWRVGQDRLAHDRERERLARARWRTVGDRFRTMSPRPTANPRAKTEPPPITPSFAPSPTFRNHPVAPPHAPPRREPERDLRALCPPRPEPLREPQPESPPPCPPAFEPEPSLRIVRLPAARLHVPDEWLNEAPDHPVPEPTDERDTLPADAVDDGGDDSVVISDEREYEPESPEPEIAKSPDEGTVVDAPPDPVVSIADRVSPEAPSESDEELRPAVQPAPTRSADRPTLPPTTPFVADTAQAQVWSWESPTSGGGVASPADPLDDDAVLWPKLSDILAQNRTQRPSARSPRPGKGRRHGEPQPTESQAPAQWSAPSWLAMTASVAMVLVLGAPSLYLAGIWATDDRTAGIVADHLLNGPVLPAKPIVLPESPGSSWWRTTARHLYFRAVALSRRPSEPDRDDQVRELLTAARSAAPLEPSVRLALVVQSSLPAIGLSRDVVALRQTGRDLLRQGRTDAALAVHRKALEFVVAADPDHATAPGFVEDSDVRRFSLPYENTIAELIGDVVGSAADPGKLDYEQWSRALPDAPLARLAAYRVMRERGDPSADRILEALGRDDGSTDRPGTRGAVDRAARAEALALAGRWDAAADGYRAAIDRMSPGLIRRSWALNLAEIEGRRGHIDAMKESWELARGTDPRDPVNLRLAEARHRFGGDSGPSAGSRRNGPDDLPTLEPTDALATERKSDSGLGPDDSTRQDSQLVPATFDHPKP